jgi:hypothetical protein
MLAMTYCSNKPKTVKGSSLDCYFHQHDSDVSSILTVETNSLSSSETSASTANEEQPRTNKPLASMWQDLVVARKQLGQHGVITPTNRSVLTPNRSVSFAAVPNVALLEPLTGSSHERMFYSYEELAEFRHNAFLEECGLTASELNNI